MTPLPDFIQFLSESAKVSVLITDARGRIVWSNAGFQRISGHSLSAIRGRKPGEFLQGERTDPACVEFMSERLKAGMGFETEILNYDSSGKEYWVSLEVTPVRDGSGELTHFIGIQHDITRLKETDAELELSRIREELKRLASERTADLVETNRRLQDEVADRQRIEAELQRSQCFLQSALDSISAHVAILDEKAVIIAVNRAWRDFATSNGSTEATHYIGSDYLEVCARSAMSGESPEASLMHRGILDVLQKNRLDFYLQYPCHTPNDERWFQARVSRFAVEGQDRLVIAHENITETKLGERRIRKHLEQLSHVQRLETMGEMSAALAHEINQPLAAISNYTSGSLRRLRQCGTVTPDVLEAMEQALAEANRAAEIIRRMRQFARNAEIQREPMSISAIVEETLAFVTADAQQRSLQIVSDLADGLPEVYADSIHIQQVLMNLIRNASDAMPETAEPSLQRIEITTSSPTSDTVEVRVTDCGSGITKEVMDRLFDPFMTTKQQGMGLGLAICRSIIEAHHGRIWAETNLDEEGRVTGSTFGFVLPASPSRPSEASGM